MPLASRTALPPSPWGKTGSLAPQEAERKAAQVDGGAGVRLGFPFVLLQEKKRKEKKGKEEKRKTPIPSMAS